MGEIVEFTGVIETGVQIIEEHFHPSGSVRFTIFHDIVINGNHFDMTGKEEMRKA